MCYEQAETDVADPDLSLVDLDLAADLDFLEGHK